jgi:hypothetical protein
VWEDHWGDVYATPANTAPTLGAIADRAMSVIDDRLAVPLELQDAEGDFLQIVARVTVANPLAEIRDAYGLSFRESYLPNLTGLHEKWLFGTGGTGFLLLPNGDLVQWQHTYADTAQRETLIARLDAAVYEDPSLLWNAAAELPAPANAYVDGHALIVDPHEGVVGDLIVRVGVSDGLEFASLEFVVSVGDDQPAFDEQLTLIAQLQEQSERLTHSEFPEFRRALTAAAASLDGIAAARAYDLLRQLDAAYEQAELDAQASADWELQEERRLTRELELARFVEQELATLLEEFNGESDGAWTNIRDSIDDVALPPGLDPADIPPIFIHGKNPAPLAVEQGHEIEFDVRAIHPFGAPRHYLDSVDGPGESFVSVVLDEDTGVVRWTPDSDHPPGVYTFVFLAQAFLAARPEDYPGFVFYDGGEAYAAAETTVV